MKNNKLLIQNLDPKLTEQALAGILLFISPVININISPDTQNIGLNCALVEFNGHRAAEQALNALNGQIIHTKKIKIEWCQDKKEIENIKLFIENIDPKADNIILNEVFKTFHPIALCVTRNNDANKPINGIITFSTREHAENAIREMNGKMVLSYPIKCSWDPEQLNKNDEFTNFKRSSTCNDDVKLANMSYEEIFAQAPLYNTSIFINNLPRQIIKQDIAPYLQQYGYVSEIYLETKEGTCVAKLDTHANAATAIFALQGIKMGGKAIQFGWAKDRLPERPDSRDGLSRSYNVFSLGHVSPKKMVQQITTVYDNHTTTRPPAPAFDQADDGNHGWNQYYQKYYSAGHLTI